MKYNVRFTLEANEDILKIQKSGDKKLWKKLHALLHELKTNPTHGTGKPEQLKHYEIPTWSRRISDKHRLVYQINDKVVTVLVLSVWGHYQDK